MVNVIIKDNQIELIGHADYDVIGKDIVCASISTATIMTLNQIVLFGLFELIESNVIDGYASITMLEKNDILKKVIDNFINVLNQLQEKHPKNIQISKL